MTGLEFIQQAYLEATGQVFNGAWGDSNAIKMLAYGNLNITNWALESSVDWESLYNLGVDCGTVGATSNIPVTGSVLKVSNKAHDYIYVTNADGNIISEWRTVPASQLKYYDGADGYVAVQGNSSAGFTLRFMKAFTSDSPEYGNHIYVPCYTIPPQMTESTSVVPVDDPNYLVYMSAADWAQPDTTLIQNVPSLISKATDRMNAMMAENTRIKVISAQTVARGAGRGDTFGNGW